MSVSVVAAHNVSTLVNVATLRRMFRTLPIAGSEVASVALVTVDAELGEVGLAAASADRVTWAGSSTMAPSQLSGLPSVMVRYVDVKAALASISRSFKTVDVAVSNGGVAIGGVNIPAVDSSTVLACRLLVDAFDWLTRPSAASAWFDAGSVAYVLAATDNTRWASDLVKNVHVYIDSSCGDYAEIVATDRFRLHRANASHSIGSTDQDRTFNIPAAAVKATMVGSAGALRVEYLPHDGASGYRGRLSYSLATGRTGVVALNVVTAVVTYVGQFPKYPDLFAVNGVPSVVRVSGSSLRQAADSVAQYVKIGKLSNRPVILDVASDAVTLSINAVDGDERALAFAPIHLPIVLSGAPMRIALNPAYLADVLAGFDGSRDSVNITLVDNTKPIIVIGADDDSTRALLMPVKL